MQVRDGVAGPGWRGGVAVAATDESDLMPPLQTHSLTRSPAGEGLELLVFLFVTVRYPHKGSKVRF